MTKRAISNEWHALKGKDLGNTRGLTPRAGYAL